MTPTTELYFEAHVTIEPVAGSSLEHFKKLANSYKFRVADLLMRKSSGKLAPSQIDSFCTSRDTDYNQLLERTEQLVTALKQHDFTVKRYKLENTLLDVRF